MKQQQALMVYDPADCSREPYPSHAEQWRTYHGNAAWLFNPWTGNQRNAGDVGSDPFGHLIVPPGEPVRPSEEDVLREARAKAYMDNQPFYEAALACAGKVATALKKNGQRVCDCGSFTQGVCGCGSAS